MSRGTMRRAIVVLVSAGSLYMFGCTTNKLLQFAGVRSSQQNMNSSAVAQEQPGPTHTQPPLEPIGARRNGILLVYPHDGETINAPSTYMIGTVASGTTLTVNNHAVKVNKEGYFAHVLPLSVGANEFSIAPNGDQTKTFVFTITRPAPAPPVAAEPLRIVAASIEPKSNRGLQPGDIVQFSMRASPGAEASVTVAGKEIKLSPAGTKSPVKTGRDTTYGVTFQQSSASTHDLYTGFYRVTPADTWRDEMPTFTLVRGSETVTQPGTGHLTVITQPFVATTLHDNTIVRLGPGAGRTTPMAAGVRVLVDGFVGDSDRCEMAPGKHLWIEKSELSETSETPGVPPAATVHTINIENEGAHGARIVVPLDQRLPYEVKQEVTPGNRLILKIYGATADTDWITEPSTSSKAVPDGSAPAAPPAAANVNARGRAFPSPRDRDHNPVSFVNWQQLGDKVYQVAANLNERQQWGFWVDYDDTNLVLHIKGKPDIDLGPTSLKGLKICVDPGHGGMETGTIGCSGTKESTVNLAIGQRVQRILKRQGAEVFMTRNSDLDVSLKERVAIAERNNADLLLSIHNNSLPDGRDPWLEHGTSSYYYHPQSLAFASNIRLGVVHSLGFNDFHTRWQNLFLCRPSKMPAQLVEVGFMSNPDELAALLTEQGQERTAKGIVDGVHQFLTQALSNAPIPATTSGSIERGRKRTPKAKTIGHRANARKSR